MIATVEKRHEVRYVKLAGNIANGTVFQKDGKIKSMFGAKPCVSLLTRLY